jgi:amino acid transporter
MYMVVHTLLFLLESKINYKKLGRHGMGLDHCKYCDALCCFSHGRYVIKKEKEKEEMKINQNLLMHGSIITTEISSAYPTSGGLYWWAARLSSKRYAPFASWMTGWFNLIGQFAVTAGINYGIALMLGATISIGTNGAWVPTVGALVGIHMAMCVTQGIANSLGTRVMTTLNSKINAFFSQTSLILTVIIVKLTIIFYCIDISTWWQVIAPAVIMITIAAKAPTHQSASFVFTDFYNGSGWESAGYVAVIGILQAQFTLTGYDSSAHMSEETKNAEISGPVGMTMAVVGK